MYSPASTDYFLLLLALFGMIGNIWLNDEKYIWKIIEMIQGSQWCYLCPDRVWFSFLQMVRDIKFIQSRTQLIEI